MTDKEKKLVTCPECGGSGRKSEVNDAGHRYYVQCERCGGKGYVVSDEEK